MRNKNKYTKLISNIAYFFVCTVLVKLVSYILLPICTEHMSTQEYGEADLIVSTINFVYPLVMLGIGGSVLRYGMDENYSKNKLLTVAQKMVLCNCMIVFLVIPFSYLFGDYGKYIYIIPIVVLLTNETNLLNDFCKSIDNTKLIVWGSGINAVVKVVFVLLFVKFLRLGAMGMLWGYMIASLVNTIFLLIASKAVSYFIRDIKREEEKKYRKDILKYGIPLVPNSLAWWILQLSDRYMVAYFVGAAANGLYAVAYKIPSILNAVVSIFSQAWQLSVIQEADSKESINYYNRIYRYYCAVCYGGTAAIIVCTKFFAKMMFQNEFYDAWRYVPILMIAAVIKCQEEFFGPFYFANKQTSKYFTSSVLGAGINIVLNFIMIPTMGIMGASISTVISYYVTYIFRAVYAKKIYGVELDFIRGLSSQIVLLLQVLAWAYVDAQLIVYALNILIVSFFLVLYRKEVIEIVGMMVTFIKKAGIRKNAD